VVTPGLGPDADARFAEHMSQFTGYLADLFARRRTKPRDDLVSALIETEEHGESLSEPELYATVRLLIVAGHETTVNLIANGALALIRHPEQLERLRATPESMPDAIEELCGSSGPSSGR
jgi:cytochrome P450